MGLQPGVVAPLDRPVVAMGRPGRRPLVSDEISQGTPGGRLPEHSVYGSRRTDARKSRDVRVIGAVAGPNVGPTGGASRAGDFAANRPGVVTGERPRPAGGRRLVAASPADQSAVSSRLLGNNVGDPGAGTPLADPIARNLDLWPADCDAGGDTGGVPTGALRNIRAGHPRITGRRGLQYTDTPADPADPVLLSRGADPGTAARSVGTGALVRRLHRGDPDWKSAGERRPGCADCAGSVPGCGAAAALSMGDDRGLVRPAAGCLRVNLGPAAGPHADCLVGVCDPGLFPDAEPLCDVRPVPGRLGCDRPGEPMGLPELGHPLAHVEWCAVVGAGSTGTGVERNPLESGPDALRGDGAGRASTAGLPKADSRCPGSRRPVQSPATSPRVPANPRSLDPGTADCRDDAGRDASGT